MDFSAALRWLAGGSRPYHNLYHCMNEDLPWVAITVFLDLTVAMGYVLIARHWQRNEALLPESPAKAALRDMKLIFVFCGLCGYVFIPVKMYWPAWRLYDGFLVVLAYFTWRYALGVRSLKVIYNELGRSAKLEADLQQSREESERKSFFLNAISHDMRTPLNGLVLQTQLAQMSLRDGDRDGAEECFAQMREAVRSANELLERFLEFGRTDFQSWPDHPTPFDASEALRAIVETHRAAAEVKGLALSIVAPDGLSVTTDRIKLERIVSNLVCNAIKFTAKGAVRIEAEGAGPQVIIRVVDTGEGISPEHLDHLFEEFYQVQNRERNPRNGFGLGLAIAHRLAAHLGGALAVESAVAQGSRFTLTIPRELRGVGHPEAGTPVRRIEAGAGRQAAHR